MYAANDADDDASCAFAMAIYDAAIAQAYESRTGASGNTVLATVNDFKVTSPVTEQTYTLRCFVGKAGDALICHQPSSAYLRLLSGDISSRSMSRQHAMDC